MLILAHYIKEHVQVYGIQLHQKVIMNFGYQKIMKMENVSLDKNLDIQEEREKPNVLINKNMINYIILILVNVRMKIGNVILDSIEKLMVVLVFLLLLYLKKMNILTF